MLHTRSHQNCSFQKTKMNNSLLANQSNSSESKFNMDLALEISEYGITVVSAIGIVLQTATIIFFSSSWFEHKFYDFLQCRSICNLIVCLFGIFHRPVFCLNCTTDYSRLIFDVYLIDMPIRVAFLASAISDNLLILNRLATIYEWRRSVFNRLSKKVNVVYIYISFLIIDCYICIFLRRTFLFALPFRWHCLCLFTSQSI